MDSVERERAIALIDALLHRYGGATLEMLEEVLLPLQTPLVKVSREAERYGTRWIGRFEIGIGSESTHISRGRTGKVVPAGVATREAGWGEVLKARVHEADQGRAAGELHAGGESRSLLVDRLQRVQVGDLLEIDRFGTTAKLESGLTEAAFVKAAQAEGCQVRRMPEDIQRDLGEYAFFDFLLERDGETRRVELKSLWGTDTSKARLIHGLGGGYVTSSCKFATQDIFTVNLWLRTGRIVDFAFARSRLRDDQHPYGLPPARQGRGGPLLPEYVTQNPVCSIGNGSWFASIGDVWDLG